jgi:predicted transposase YdaD
VSKPFDASPKALLQYRPADWPAFIGVNAISVDIVDADISTVTAAADKVLLLHATDGNRIQHFDFQSGPDAMVPRRTHRYNALLEDRHDLPVESIVVLLARKANLRTINGTYECRLPGEPQPYLLFRYRVIRVWELPVETVLSAGLSVLPLAPISDVRRERLPAVIERMEERFATLPDPSKIGELWTTTRVLMGLRYDEVFTEQLLQGVRAMKESVTYQAIVKEGLQKGLQEGLQKGLQKGLQEGLQKGLQEGLQEGKVQEARQILLRIGADQFKDPPNPEQLQELEAIIDVGHLENLAVRASHVSNWSELLASPTTPQPRRRKKS